MNKVKLFGRAIANFFLIGLSANGIINMGRMTQAMVGSEIPTQDKLIMLWYLIVPATFFWGYYIVKGIKLTKALRRLEKSESTK